MTVSATTPRSGRFVGDGKQTRFDFDFFIFSANDLQVYLNSEIITDGYTVTVLSGNGYVTFNTPPLQNDSIILKRELTIEQQTSLPNGSDIFLPTLEKTFDRLVMFIQQVQEQVDRSITLAVTSEEVSTEEYLELAQLAASTAEAAQEIASAAAETATTARATAVASAAQAETDAAKAEAANESAEALIDAVNNIATDIGINEVNFSLGKRTEGTAILSYGRRTNLT